MLSPDVAILLRLKLVAMSVRALLKRVPRRVEQCPVRVKIEPFESFLSIKLVEVDLELNPLAAEVLVAPSCMCLVPLARQFASIKLVLFSFERHRVLAGKGLPACHSEPPHQREPVLHLSRDHTRDASQHNENCA